MAPSQAFCEALFARAPVALWIASRGFGGKTSLLALLAAANAILFETDVIIIGWLRATGGAGGRTPAPPVGRRTGSPGVVGQRTHVQQDHLGLGQHDPGPDSLTDRRARLPVVLSGNARTPRVADRGPGHAEAWRAVPDHVGRRV